MKKIKSKRLTKKRLISILEDVAHIEDKELRMRITNNLIRKPTEHN